MDYLFSGTNLSLGSVNTDKARGSSVEYWQKTANDLSVQNEELRKQLAVFQQSKGVAVQEVLTQLFVEKVQDVSGVEGIVDSFSHGKVKEDFVESRLSLSLCLSVFQKMH